MNLEELKKLAEEWANNPGCQDKFRRDPIQYLKARGYEINDETQTKLESLHAMSDEEIEERINKGTC